MGGATIIFSLVGFGGDAQVLVIIRSPSDEMLGREQFARI
jgi:hypothetical protein